MKWDYGVGCSMDEIEPRLYLGNAFCLKGIKILQDAGITHILSIFTGSITLAEELQGITHMHIKIDDDGRADLMRHFATTNRFIEEALEGRKGLGVGDDDLQPFKKGGGVFVHCAMGRSRSATIVAAYLMRRHNLDSKAAIERLRSIRPVVSPNPGFMWQLEIYGRAQCDIVANPAGYLEWIRCRKYF